MTAQLGLEVKHRKELLKSANETAELKELEYFLKTLVGDSAKDNNGEIDLTKIRVMDLVIYAATHDKDALDNILELSRVAKDNPVFIQSIISQMQLQGMKPEDIGKALKDMGIDVSPHELPQPAPEDIQIFEDSGLFGDIDFGLLGLLAKLAQGKGGQDNDAHNVEVLILLLKQVPPAQIVATHTDNSGNQIQTTRQGVLNNFLMNQLINDKNYDITNIINTFNLKATDKAQHVTDKDGNSYDLDIDKSSQYMVKDALDNNQNPEKTIRAVSTIGKAIGGSRSSLLEEIIGVGKLREVTRIRQAAKEVLATLDNTERELLKSDPLVREPTKSATEMEEKQATARTWAEKVLSEEEEKKERNGGGDIGSVR